MTGLETDNLFWRFSLRVYGAPGVADECLAVQDKLGVDVNVLLFAAWLGAERGVVLDWAGLRRIEEAVAVWSDHVVKPLRAVRRRLKQMPGIEDPEVQALRKRVAETELLSEQIEQALLYRLSGDFGRGAGSAAATQTNVAAVIAAHGADAARFPLSALFAACGSASETQ